MFGVGSPRGPNAPSNESSAIENITVLFTERDLINVNRVTSREVRDDVRPHMQRPEKAEVNGHRFKTEDSVSTPMEY